MHGLSRYRQQHRPVQNLWEWRHQKQPPVPLLLQLQRLPRHMFPQLQLLQRQLRPQLRLQLPPAPIWWCPRESQFLINSTSPTRHQPRQAVTMASGCLCGLIIKDMDPLYTYEWYPDGRLVTQYLGNIPYPGWQKMWFYGDAPGWHTLQYFCNGWSNYIYVYVNGGTTAPTQPPAQGCNARIVVSSPYARGYSVYVDGYYKGGDGQNGDPMDGYYEFYVPGGQLHTVKVYYQGGTYQQTKTYYCGSTYMITISSAPPSGSTPPAETAPPAETTPPSEPVEPVYPTNPIALPVYPTNPIVIEPVPVYPTQPIATPPVAPTQPIATPPVAPTQPIATPPVAPTQPIATPPVAPTQPIATPAGPTVTPY